LISKNRSPTGAVDLRNRNTLRSLLGRRPVIGVVHLAPLPGSPEAPSLDQTVARAVADAAVWERNGADALLIENFGDRPFYPDRVPPITIASMSRVLSRIQENSALPLGVNVLRNDACAALALAEAFGLRFIRVNVHAGVQVSDQGLLVGIAHRTLRQRAAGTARPWIFADLRVKHSAPLVARDLLVEAEELIERAGADVILLSGTATGRPPPVETLETLSMAFPRFPFLLASGVDPDLIQVSIRSASGFIVGTFAQDGRAGRPPRPELVRQLVAVRDRGLRLVLRS